MTRIPKSWLLVLLAVVSTIAIWASLGLTTIRQNFDGPYYAVVARTFYNKQAIGTKFSFPLPLEYYAAHLPLFPSLMRALTFAHLNYLDAGILINLLATIAVALVLYKMSNSFWVSAAWLFVWPRIWAVRSIASPETLFILFVLLSTWSFKLKKYWLAGLAGAAAVVTKSPGILLFVAFSLWGLIESVKTKKWHWELFPIHLIPFALLLVFAFYQHQTGDFLAYFHSGDNIHLQALPFRVFDSSQPWVGDFWLEDVLWVYLVGGLGVYYLAKKDWSLAIFPLVYYVVILFVSHRDVSRYALPIAPFALMGMSKLLDKKEIRVALALLVIPSFFYTLNFLSHNQIAIADWAPFLWSSK